MNPRELAQKSADDLPYRLKAARKSMGITQDQLAERAELSTVALSKFESGVNRPNFENLVALAHALQTSPNYLVGWDLTSEGGESAEKRDAINRLIVQTQKLSPDWIEQLTEIAVKARG